MSFELRDYQLETIDNITDSIKSGHHSIIVQQPPRTGKTVIMSEIARRATAKGNRVLFIVHRKEIVDQAKKTFISNEVDMNLATVGMVQTITRRVDKLEEPTIIFIDEAHHALSKTYRRIIDKFPKATKLLFTATPIRLSGEGFTDIADDLIIGKPIEWLIDNNFLAPVDYYAPNQMNAIDLKVKRNGEFDEKSIEEALKPKVYGNVVATFKKLSSDKQAIAYTYNVASAEKLADQFNQSGITAKAVSGKTPKDERDQIINDYRDGKIQVVTNAELFTEGLDLPNVDTVVMLRPTQSLSLYLQFAMRSMNPRKGKRALIIDHVGNIDRFGSPTADRDWTLEGTKKQSRQSGDAPTMSITTCESCFAVFERKNLTNCPYCGAPISEPKELETDEQAELEKIELRQKRLDRVKKILNSKVAGKTPSQLKSIDEIKEYAKLHNYKPGWVYYYSKQRGFIK